MRWLGILTLGLGTLAPATACIHVKTEPVVVKFEGTLDINIRIDKALDDFYSWQKKPEAAAAPSEK